MNQETNETIETNKINEINELEENQSTASSLLKSYVRLNRAVGVMNTKNCFNY